MPSATITTETYKPAMFVCTYYSRSSLWLNMWQPPVAVVKLAAEDLELRRLTSDTFPLQEKLNRDHFPHMSQW